MNCDECKSRLRKDNDTSGHWCPVCSLNNARARQLKAERERDEARAELERVKAERDSAQHFLSRIIEHCDDDGIMADDTTINLVAARKAAGIQEP